MSVWSHLKHNIGLQSKIFIIICVILTLLTAIASILQPLLLTKAVDFFDDKKIFWLLIYSSLGVHFITRIASEARWFFIGHFEESLISTLKLYYLKKILAKSPNFLKDNHIGEILSKIQFDGSIISLSRNIMFFILPTTLNILMIIFITYNVFSGIYCLVLICSIAIFIITLFHGSNYLDIKAKSYINASTKAFSVLSDLLFNRNLLYFYHYEDHEAVKYTNALHISAREAVKSANRRGLFGMIQGLSIFFAISSTILFSVNDLIDGKITIGNFILINTYILQLLSPLESLSKIYREIKTSILNFKILNDTIDAQPEMSFGNAKLDAKRDNINLEFKGVSFHYPGTQYNAIEDINLTIYQNSFICIVGKSGAGKSTFISLLMRLNDPIKGEITVNDINLATLSRENLHQIFAVMPQMTHVLTDTIEANILMGTEDTQINKTICSILGINQFVDSLSDGYRTIISMHNKQLSEGQLQRIALARILMSDKPILIFDEPSSALDYITESLFHEALKTLIGKKTIIMITHKFDLMPLADKIVVLNNHKIAEIGKHQELLAMNGIYATLKDAMVN